jgi:hypothetical protein
MDNLSNFASSTLASGIDATQTTAILTTGQGDRFPTENFNVIIWDASYNDMTVARYDNALAIYRVESRTDDVLTFVTVSGVREAQEGTSAITHNTGGHTYNVAQGVTAKLFDDVEPNISAGLTTQYWRGDKTWQILPTSTTSGIDAYSADFTVSGWGGPTDGYYTQDFTHNLGKAAINVTVWDLTSTPALTLTDVDIISNDVVRLKVLASPDKRFAGRIVVSSGGSGANSQYQDTGVHRLKASILDPNTAYVKDTQICLWPYVDAPIFITSIHATCDIAPPNEITGNLMYADNFISLANSGIVNTFNTVSGVYSTDLITSSSVTTGKCIYLDFTSLPDSAINQFSVDITFEYQTGV